MRHRLVHLAAWFYLLASVLSAAHLHLPGKHHAAHDCKICVVSQNLHSGDVPAEQTSFFVDTVYSLSVCDTSFYVPLPLIKGYNAKAPPLYS